MRMDVRLYLDGASTLEGADPSRCWSSSKTDRDQTGWSSRSIGESSHVGAVRGSQDSCSYYCIPSELSGM